MIFHSIKPFLFIIFTTCLLTSCSQAVPTSSDNSLTKVIYQNDEKYAELDNLTQTGLFHALGEVIIKDPIIGGHVPQTIGGDILPTIAQRNVFRSLDYDTDMFSASPGIAYPALLKLPLSEQKKIADLSVKNNPKELRITFAGTGVIDVEAFQASFGRLPKTSSIQFEFYDIPANYYELFEALDTRLTKDSEISIQIMIPDLPLGFSVDAFFLHIKKWISRHPSDLMIKSFSFSILNAPGVQFVLNNPESILGDFPAMSISADPVIIDTRGAPPGDGPKGKAIIEELFHKSQPQNMQFSFGKKEGEMIEVYGY